MSELIPIYHVIKGESRLGAEDPQGRFATPALNLNELIWPRHEPGPAFDVPLSQIMDILQELAKWIGQDPDGIMAQALEQSAKLSTLPRDVLARSFAHLPQVFDRRSMEFQVETELGGADVLDGWRTISHTPSGRTHRMRAFPPRLVHIVAGNAPGVSAQTIMRGALSKGVHLLKIPSNDLFTATALLRGLAAVAPNHPLTRSFSAVYWRGGDQAVESMLFRPQFFDKLVAWGGEAALRSAKNYIGPGFELVAFDPKTSISLIGREAFTDDGVLAEVAEKAAADVTVMNQQACVASRFQFVEGTLEQVDRFCQLLHSQLSIERPTASAVGKPLSSDLREEIEGLKGMEPFYKVWGRFDGSGVVVRSEEPVDFHPDQRVVNVIAVNQLNDAVRFANVATQTVGVYPTTRKTELRNALASMGTQRVVELGNAGSIEAGISHDGFFPLMRFMRWVNDEG